MSADSMKQRSFWLRPRNPSRTWVNGSSEATNRFRERSAPLAMPEILPKSRVRKVTILSLSPCVRERRTIAAEA